MQAETTLGLGIEITSGYARSFHHCMRIALLWHELRAVDAGSALKGSLQTENGIVNTQLFRVHQSLEISSARIPVFWIMAAKQEVQPSRTHSILETGDSGK